MLVLAIKFNIEVIMMIVDLEKEIAKLPTLKETIIEMGKSL